MRKFVDLTGREFGRLRVLAPAGKSKNNSYLFECVCTCGNTKVARASHLLRGEIASCGCLGAESRQTSRPIHGHSPGRSNAGKASPTYESWAAMKARCLYSKHPQFHNYGGRGIQICERWSRFENFLTDMGERPKGKELDRYPDKDGNYEPTNCRWATSKEQGRNRRNNRILTLENRSATLSEWAEITGIGFTTIRERLNRGWSQRRALCTPVQVQIRRGIA